jgi:hypothetical protein
MMAMAIIHPEHNTNDINITSILHGLTISIETDAFITIKNEEPIDVSTLFPNEDGYINIYTDAGCRLSLKSANVRIIQNGLNLEIFRCKYFCNIAQQFTQDVFEICEGHIINKHTFMVLEPNTDGPRPNPAYYIRTGFNEFYRSLSPGVTEGYRIVFVFDIEDTREKLTYAVKQLLDILPKELVDKIAFYLGCNKFKYEYMLTDFPVIFETKYKGEMPTYLSRHQLKKLYELGVLKIALEYNYDFHMLTDESFDYNYDLYMSRDDLFDDQYKALIKTFDSKEIMNQFSESFISHFFKNVL